jgi:hypothetical protein
MNALFSRLRSWCRGWLHRSPPARNLQTLKIDTYNDFKISVVEADFREFMADKTSLRKAWQCAGSLFHLHEWVYKAHKTSIDANYTFVDDLGVVQQVSRPEYFANSLGQAYPNFQLIRGIANASKHFALRTVPPGRQDPPGMPSSAANTYVIGVGFQPGAFQGGNVMLQANPDDIEFSGLAQSVLDMWNGFFRDRGW